MATPLPPTGIARVFSSSSHHHGVHSTTKDKDKDKEKIMRPEALLRRLLNCRRRPFDKGGKDLLWLHLLHCRRGISESCGYANCGNAKNVLAHYFVCRSLANPPQDCDRCPKELALSLVGEDDELFALIERYRATDVSRTRAFEALEAEKTRLRELSEKEREKDAAYLAASEALNRASAAKAALFRRLCDLWVELGIENQKLRGGGKPRAFSVDSVEDAGDSYGFGDPAAARQLSTMKRLRTENDFASTVRYDPSYSLPTSDTPYTIVKSTKA